MAVQTQIQTRRGTAASWTSTNPTLAAGEIGFESDTNKFKIGTGSTAWASLPYAANTSPLTTKGDLYTYSTADARLAVGANGETIVADSSTSTGLRYQPNFSAGKNKIINGAFDNWQRGTSFTITSTGQYTTDRFASLRDGNGTVTLTRQTFTAGTAPAAGYESQYFAQVAVSAVGTTSYYTFIQPIESVRTLAGQTVTVSFWARLSSGTSPSVYSRFEQFFGSGGSASVNTDSGSFAFTGTWTRYSTTFTVPSISGKTITTSDYLGAGLILATGGNNSTVQIWGYQVEAGNTATAFQTATGTIQGELAACQRYYYRSYPNLAYGTHPAQGQAQTTTSIAYNVNLPQSMRVTPTAVEFSNLAAFDSNNVLALSGITLDVNQSSPKTAWVGGTVTGAVQYRSYFLLNNNNATGYIGLTAEL
jgi:hypothetical protein